MPREHLACCHAPAGASSVAAGPKFRDGFLEGFQSMGTVLQGRGFRAQAGPLQGHPSSSDRRSARRVRCKGDEVALMLYLRLVVG